ncbi:RidA family protein [Pseudotabrizicola sp. 4114]|uniref:RidA family protein n=1 Tax=Pseudotabrizicola sp. 4114 TaxID=2817731 RepID=UPI002862864B|nr:enamine deaminase RidA (YjgF/YER057c/UK114 family) [Pseudorhodobacter sp. 4114]
MSPDIQKLNPENLPDAGPLGYSQLAVASPGRMVFISGQVAVSVDGTPVPPALADQVTIVLRNLSNALAAAGATPDHVVSLRIYVVDLESEDIAALMAPVAEMFGGQAPALTGIGVSALAGPQFKVEIEAVAVI